MATFKTMDASVVGTKLVLSETDNALTTKPLPNVPVDTELDSIVGVNDGAVKQISTAVDTTSFTENGITFNLSKRNGVITITASSGSLTNAVGDGDTVATIPSGYRPTHTLQVWEVANSRRMAITSAGVISMVSAITSGSYIRFTVTYVGG